MRGWCLKGLIAEVALDGYWFSVPCAISFIRFTIMWLSYSVTLQFLSQGAALGAAHSSVRWELLGILSSPQKVPFLRWTAQKEERRSRDTKQSLAFFVSCSQGSFYILALPSALLSLIPAHSSSFSLPCLMWVIYILLFSTYNFIFLGSWSLI